MNTKRILVVDDSQVILATMSMKLRAAGYEVLTAEDGSAAVSTARTEKPDLILLDISFPPDVARGGGVAGFFHKPIQTDELLAAIRQLLGEDTASTSLPPSNCAALS